MNNIDRFFCSDPMRFASDYLSYLQVILQRLDTAEIAGFIETLLEARRRGAIIFFIGNGGSAATASHFANDLAIGTRDYERPFRAISLTDNVAILTAVGNDFGYEEVFVRQLRVLAKAGDVLIGISASGNSPNLLRAFEFAHSAKMRTVAITGFDGGKLKLLAGQCIHVRTEPQEYGPAEDVHMVLDHLVTSYLSRCVRIGGGEDRADRE